MNSWFTETLSPCRPNLAQWWGSHLSFKRYLYQISAFRAFSLFYKGKGHIAYMGEMRNAYKIFVGKREGRRLFIRPRRRWEVNIRIDLRETGWEGVDWLHLYLNNWVTISFSRTLLHGVSHLFISFVINKYINKHNDVSAVSFVAAVTRSWKWLIERWTFRVRFPVQRKYLFLWFFLAIIILWVLQCHLISSLASIGGTLLVAAILDTPIS